MRAKDCWVRAYAATAIAVYLYLCVFFFCISSSIFNAFLLISNQIYPRSYLFAIALIRIHCCFFYIFIPPFVGSHVCSTHLLVTRPPSQLNTHKPHWIALTEPVQSKYTLIQKRIYSYFIFDNVRQIYIYNFFLVLFYFFVVLGIFLGSADEGFSFFHSPFVRVILVLSTDLIQIVCISQNNRERNKSFEFMSIQMNWKLYNGNWIDPMCIQLILHFSNMIFI